MSQHKLLVFAGPCVEETGELMLQTGCFSLRDFIQIFTDKEVRGRATGGVGSVPGRAVPSAHVPSTVVERGGAGPSVGAAGTSLCLLRGGDWLYPDPEHRRWV